MCKLFMMFCAMSNPSVCVCVCVCVKEGNHCHQLDIIRRKWIQVFHSTLWAKQRSGGLWWMQGNSNDVSDRSCILPCEVSCVGRMKCWWWAKQVHNALACVNESGFEGSTCPPKGLYCELISTLSVYDNYIIAFEEMMNA